MAHPWEVDLEAARRELAVLDPGALLQVARAQAAAWRPVQPRSDFFLPLPLVAQDVPSRQGDWTRPEEQLSARHDALALDERGRPIAYVLDAGDSYERLEYFWRWDEDGSFVETELMGSGPHIRRARVAGGRVAHVATASAGDSVSVRSITWRDGAAVRCDEASRWSATIGVDRALVATVSGGEIEAVRLGARDAEGSLADGLQTAATLVPDRLIWDGRVERPAPWPGRDAVARDIEPLARELDGALRAAAAAADIAEPFVLEVHGGNQPAFPPRALLAGAAWRDGMRGARSTDGAALQSLHRGVEAGLVAELALVDRLSPGALATCRVLSTALRVGAPWDRNRTAGELADAVGERLASLLNATPPPGAADPFLALVELGDPFGGDPSRGLDRARRAVGDAGVERFMASLRSSVRAAAPADRASTTDALTDRHALEALLSTTPLAAHAARLAHDVAAEGLILVAAPAGTPAPRSRLGGPAVLPVGAEWPVSAGGSPLSFLAALDLAELPPVAALPEPGWLVYFALLSGDDGDGLYEPEANVPGSAARVLFGADVAPAEPPPALHTVEGGVLAERRVTARPVLTLPGDYDAAARLGLDTFAAEAYDEVFWGLQERLPADAHWVGGHQTGVQGHPPEQDTTLLLHLAWDPALGFTYLDGGAVQFRIPDAALSARDWSQVFASGDSA